MLTVGGFNGDDDHLETSGTPPCPAARMMASTPRFSIALTF
jgi:hypothetical protein